MSGAVELVCFGVLQPDRPQEKSMTLCPLP